MSSTTPMLEKATDAVAAAAAAHSDDPIVLSSLTHDYGTRLALDHLSFSVAPAQIFGLLGPNGSGKTTLFRILSTLMVPSGGLATIRGAFFGAALIVVFPLVLSRIGALIFGGLFDSGVLDMSQRIVIGALIIVFLIAEPNGLVALWDRLTKGLTART